MTWSTLRENQKRVEAEKEKKSLEATNSELKKRIAENDKKLEELKS